MLRVMKRGTTSRRESKSVLSTVVGTWLVACTLGAVLTPVPAYAQKIPGAVTAAADVREAGGESRSRKLRGLRQFEQRLRGLEGRAKLQNDSALADTYDTGEDRVRVLVLLRMDNSGPQAALFESPESRARLRQDIAARQSAVISGTSPAETTVVSQYENFPGLACEVTTTGLASLMADPNVEAIQPDMLVTTHLGQGIPMMSAEVVRTLYDGTGLTVAVIDDGVDYTHPYLGNGSFPNTKVTMGIDTSGTGDSDPFPGGNNSHGTSVAGIIGGDIPASITNDYIGGVAPGVKIAAVKTFPDGSGTTLFSDVAEGIDWCVTNQFADPSNPIMIINMSLGGGEFTSAFNAAQATPVVLASVNAAVAAGITVIASSGNDGYCNAMGTPGALEPVISVGAVYDANIGGQGWCVDAGTCYPGGVSGLCGSSELTAIFESTAAGQVTAYSNTANFLDVFGASNAAFTLQTGGGFTSSFGGTSAASPYVAGVAALLQSAYLAQNGSFIEPSLLRSTLVDTGSPITDTKGGGLTPGITKPLVNAAAAYEFISSDNPFPAIAVSEESLGFAMSTGTTATRGLIVRNEAEEGGIDLEFSVGLSVDDGIALGDEFVGTANIPFAPDDFISYGNVFDVDTSTYLNAYYSLLDFTGPAALTYFVYEMDSVAQGFEKVRIFSATVNVNGSGAQYYGIINLNVPLHAGKLYIIAVGWESPSISAYAEYDNGNHPDTVIGPVERGFALNYPVSEPYTAPLNNNPYTFPQVLTLGSVVWLSSDTASGTIAPQASQTVTVGANANGFPAGTYSGQVTISSNDGTRNPLQIPVGLRVGLQGQIYVDFGFGGTEFGTMANPYNTVNESLSAVLPDGTVTILGGGFSPETLDVAQSVTIEAAGGEATLGETEPVIEVSVSGAERAPLVNGDASIARTTAIQMPSAHVLPAPDVSNLRPAPETSRPGRRGTTDLGGRRFR